MFNWVLCLLLYSSFSSSERLIPPSEDGRLYNTNELIELRGYKSEKHDVITDDGYNLTVFRVLPSVTPSPVVLIQHGLACSSDCFVTDKDALAFMMSKSGYDVWISNARGNYYSRKHVSLSPDDPRFWDYSFHEIGVKDLTAYIDYILKITGQENLYYIGHSMGTTVFYVMMSVRPEYNSKVRAMASMAPVAYFVTYAGFTANGTATAKMGKQYMHRVAEQGKVEAFPRVDVKSSPSQQVQCSDALPQFQSYCYALIGLVKEILGEQYIPAGISLKTVEHYRQATSYGQIRYLDYESTSANVVAYNNNEPPPYNLSLVTTPVSLYYCDQDKFVSQKEIDVLVKALPNVVEVFKVPSDDFDHGDFMFPVDADNKYRVELYQKIIDYFKKFM